MNKKIHEMKKIILHLHLDGSLRPQTVYEWLNEKGIEITLGDVKSKLSVTKYCKNLNEYLEKFSLPIEFLQSEDKIERATYELFEDLSKQNVIYAEIRFAPCQHLKKGLSYEQVVESAISGMQKAKQKFNIDGNLILCCMRGDNNKEQNINTIKIAKKYLDKGVCAVDLAGAEAIFHTENFNDIFKLARELNIPFTIHAGEAAGPESMKKAIEFGAQRIGHGIRCIEDKSLMQEIKDKKITLEICPTSNIQTHAFEGKHPLEEIYNSGISVTINTDNDTVSNTNIEREYIWVLENTILTYDDLIIMNINAAKASFTNPQKRLYLENRILF